MRNINTNDKAQTFAAILLALMFLFIVNVALGALFAWVIEAPLERILEREIYYWDIFWITFASVIFLRSPQFKSE